MEILTAIRNSKLSSQGIPGTYERGHTVTRSRVQGNPEGGADADVCAGGRAVGNEFDAWLHELEKVRAFGAAYPAGQGEENEEK